MYTSGLMIGACVLNQSVACFIYSDSYSKIIKGSLFDINRNLQAKTDDSNLQGRVIEFLQTHSSAQQLSRLKVTKMCWTPILIKIENFSLALGRRELFQMYFNRLS